MYNLIMDNEKDRKSTDAELRAVKKYQTEKVEDIKLHVPKGKKEYYKGAADRAGMSLNQFAMTSMDEKIDRDNL